MLVKYDVPISKLSTFKNKGKINKLFIFDTLSELQSFIQQQSSFFVIGKGSNLLINPANTTSFIQLSAALTTVRFEGKHIWFPAGFTVYKMLTVCRDLGLTGLEFSAGVPASVGGMVAMNFGCWGKEISHYIVKVKLMDQNGQLFELTSDEMNYAYRDSILSHHNWIIVEALFNLASADKDQIRSNIKSNIQYRVNSQPLKDRTFGSVFKNPKGLYAGQLLEEMGFKGRPYKGVGMSDKHANFMLNATGEASYQEAYDFINLIQNTMYKQYGFKFDLEVKCV